MYGSWSTTIWLGVVGGALLLIALGLFASPLIAVLLALIVAGGVVALVVIRRSRSAVRAPGGSDRDAVTPEGKPVPPTGRGSGAPASGEG